MYDASRRILASSGSYVTCFGDEHSAANPNLKSHMRSLRRSFFKKDKKNIGYEWIGTDSGEDCRDALPKGDTSAPASPAFFPWRMDLEHSTPSFAGHKKAPALSLCAWLELAWTLQKEYLGRLVNHASPSFLGIFVFSRNVFEEGPA